STSSDRNTVFLTWNNWNDYSYLTLFGLIYNDTHATSYNIGNVRIGYFGQKEGERKLAVGNEFRTIGEEFFSLGAGTVYYENLNQLNSDIREKILLGLRDIAFLPNVLMKAQNENVTKVSLFRGLVLRTVTEQYRRMALGGAKLTNFRFWFESPQITPESPEMKLLFSVYPESNPPTNVHVLIGRNGVGKTNMINNMISSLYKGLTDSSGVYFDEMEDKFVNVVLVSFSAFDTVKPLFDQESELTGINFKYIGLK